MYPEEAGATMPLGRQARSGASGTPEDCGVARDGGGIAIAEVPHHDIGVRTMSVRVPDELAAWVEHAAHESNQSISALIRDILAQHWSDKSTSALDLVRDLCGYADSGLGDLSYNPKHLEGFGQGHSGSLTPGHRWLSSIATPEFASS